MLYLEGVWKEPGKDDVAPPAGSISLHNNGNDLLVITENDELFERWSSRLWFEQVLIDIPLNSIGAAVLNGVYYCLVLAEN